MKAPSRELLTQAGRRITVVIDRCDEKATAFEQKTPPLAKDAKSLRFKADTLAAAARIVRAANTWPTDRAAVRQTAEDLLEMIG